MAKKRKRKIWLWIFVSIAGLIIIFSIYFRMVTRISPPTELDPLNMGYAATNISPGILCSENNWLKENSYGLWELALRGDPFELGVRNGLLTTELIKAQEDAFVNQIEVMIPSKNYLKFLKYFIAWFNKDLDKHISQEYLLEIYGISAFSSDNYGFIGPKYDRILNYHAAHDIGHALQNMNLVECTAFGIWDERTADGSLLIGRNFDFYVGDEFAKNKILAFVQPENGYRFVSVTWAGMIGVVSGMNDQGLTITLNSAKSDIPFGARTPVSIIAREILQYASNIEEALAIASAKESFVSESFLIGSASDHRTVVIEKSTDTTCLFDPDSNFIILTNHFQSEALVNTGLNLENMANKTSVYRHEKVRELLEKDSVINVEEVAAILRNRDGKNKKNIGNGNELAINQLIAHHAIIFEPGRLRFWISTAPWQLGPFLCYDLESVLSGGISDTSTYVDYLTIPADTFMGTKAYSDFIDFRQYAEKINKATKAGEPLVNEKENIQSFISSNPEYYNTYVIAGRYYQQMNAFDDAMKYYNLALTKEVSSATEVDNIKEWIDECRQR
jgi:hypothetical protein